MSEANGVILVLKELAVSIVVVEWLEIASNPFVKKVFVQQSKKITNPYYLLIINKYSDKSRQVKARQKSLQPWLDLGIYITSIL